jgi:hypothetical protein
MNQIMASTQGDVNDQKKALTKFMTDIGGHQDEIERLLNTMTTLSASSDPVRAQAMRQLQRKFPKLLIFQTNANKALESIVDNKGLHGTSDAEYDALFELMVTLNKSGEDVKIFGPNDPKASVYWDFVSKPSVQRHFKLVKLSTDPKFDKLAIWNNKRLMTTLIFDQDLKDITTQEVTELTDFVNALYGSPLQEDIFGTPADPKTSKYWKFVLEFLPKIQQLQSDKQAEGARLSGVRQQLQDIGPIKTAKLTKKAETEKKKQERLGKYTSEKVGVEKDLNDAITKLQQKVKELDATKAEKQKLRDILNKLKYGEENPAELGRLLNEQRNNMINNVYVEIIAKGQEIVKICEQYQKSLKDKSIDESLRPQEAKMLVEEINKIIGNYKDQLLPIELPDPNNPRLFRYAKVNPQEFTNGKINQYAGRIATIVAHARKGNATGGRKAVTLLPDEEKFYDDFRKIISIDYPNIKTTQEEKEAEHAQLEGDVYTKQNALHNLEHHYHTAEDVDEYEPELATLETNLHDLDADTAHYTAEEIAAQDAEQNIGRKEANELKLGFGLPKPRGRGKISKLDQLNVDDISNAIYDKLKKKRSDKRRNNGKTSGNTLNYLQERNNGRFTGGVITDKNVIKQKILNVAIQPNPVLALSMLDSVKDVFSGKEYMDIYNEIFTP